MNRIYTLCLPVAVSAMMLGQISTAWGADNKFQQGVRGGGGGAVRSGPAISHAAGPAHFSAPRMSTPNFAAPHMNTQRFATPRVNTPRIATPRVYAPAQHVTTPRNFATTSRNFNHGTVTGRSITHTPTVNRNAITNNNVINRNTINRTNRNLALRNNITPNTTAAGTNLNRFNTTNRNFNRFGNRNNAAVANRQFTAANAARAGNAARAANNARFAAFRNGAFHPGWNTARAYYWNHHHWRCYNGVWAVVDVGWPGDWYGYPYPFAYDNTVYYGGDVYEPGPQPEAVGGSMVADVQADLASMGYNPGPADGMVGPQTSNAIAQYQEDNGLAVTGQIDGALLDSLGL